MHKALPTMPVSDMRIRQAEVLERIRETPVLLTQRGHGAGVLVHPRAWNYMVEVYEKARDAGLLEVQEAQLLEWDDVEREFFTQEPAHVAEKSYA